MSDPIKPLEWRGHELTCFKKYKSVHKTHVKQMGIFRIITEDYVTHWKGTIELKSPSHDTPLFTSMRSGKDHVEALDLAAKSMAKILKESKEFIQFLESIDFDS